MKTWMKTATAAGIAACVTGVAAGSMTITDDLTDAMFDPAFDYNLFTGSDFTGSFDFNELDTFGLLLASDLVEVTFPGVAGPVTEATVTFADFAGIGATNVDFVGAISTVSFANTTIGSPETVSVTQADGLGEILAIRISSFEGFVTEVGVNFVPGVSSVGVLAMGGLVASRRRR